MWQLVRLVLISKDAASPLYSWEAELVATWYLKDLNAEGVGYGRSSLAYMAMLRCSKVEHNHTVEHTA